MKTIIRILLLIAFAALFLLLCRCSDDEDYKPARPMTMEEVRKHLTGPHEVKFEKGDDYWHYIIYLPDGAKGIIPLSVARELCIVFAGKYCDYKKLK